MADFDLETQRIFDRLDKGEGKAFAPDIEALFNRFDTHPAFVAQQKAALVTTPNDISGDGRDEYGRPVAPLAPAPPAETALSWNVAPVAMSNGQMVRPMPFEHEAREFLQPSPDADNFLPLAGKIDDATLRFAVPNWARAVGTGALDLMHGPETGVVTPEATGALATAIGAPGLRSVARGTGAAIGERAGGQGWREIDPLIAKRVHELAALRGGMPPVAGEAPVGVAAPIAAASEGGPRSVGAAASREGTAPGLIDEVTPAQKATALQKMVNQSAEERLTPGGRDDAVYFPGVERPEAMKDFSPAGEGGQSTAMQHKVLYNTDTAYHDQFDAQVKRNNGVMVDTLHDMFGDANIRDAAMNEAKELMPGSIDLFAGEKAVNAQPIEARIHGILASPAGKRKAVKGVLNDILSNLKDADGNLESMPSMLKGIRDDITDRLYDKSPTVEGNAARTARNQLQDVLAVVDDTIAKGLPGTKYQDYLENLSEALGKVSKLDYMQQFLAGPKKLTDQAGNLQLSKVNRMLDDIQKRHADKTGGAKEMTMQEINLIEAARNELAAKDLLDRRAAVRGSPTAQLQNASGILGSGPLGAGVKGAAEAATHAALAATTGGVGNAFLGGYKYIIKPSIQAARDRASARALADTRARLLDTSPSPHAHE